MNTVEKWGVFEVRTEGIRTGNPFVERSLRATFTSAMESVTVAGFYDGDGVYIARFMPSFEGEYRYVLDGDYGGGRREGAFKVLPPSEGNHGPVRVAGTWHFAYADGTPYYSIGTTCYVWELQSDARIEETIESLKASAFNKLRFCVFPKHYEYNLGEPRSYPYEGTPMDSSALTPENFGSYTYKSAGNHFDFTRFNPAHFRHVEQCVERLMALGIEADLILLHPYDRWGFSAMTRAQDDLYFRYVIARFAAYRNVWWSLANEYDLLPEKSLSDWERLGNLLATEDPFGHLRSVHNCLAFYDYTRPWITHCSIQRQDLYKTAEMVNEWRARFRKPVVLDEIAYEGNLQHGWGNLPPEELTRRFWEAACRGGYPGHGETYLGDLGASGEAGLRSEQSEGLPTETRDRAKGDRRGAILWWSHGGKLRGESWKRFKLLLDTLKQTPGLGLMPYERCGWDEVCAVPEREAFLPVKSYYLCYYSFMRPSFRDLHFDDATRFSVRVIDTWAMTIEERGVFSGSFRVALPGKPYMAIQIRKVE